MFARKMRSSRIHHLRFAGFRQSPHKQAFICKYRENGGKAIWKEYNVGHELNEEALDFARQFFADILEKRKPIFVGEDETMRVLPIGKDSEIDEEFRNYMTSGELKKLWEAR